MFDFIRTHQLDIMLALSAACFTMALLLVITKFLSKRRKWILVMMELIATSLLMFDRQAYMYSGNVTRTGLVMVRVSNFVVFFLTSGVVFVFNLYLTDLLTEEGKLEKIPKRLRLVTLLSIIGMVLAVIAAFTGLYYSFDSMNVYHRGPGFLISYIVPGVCPFILFSVVRQYKRHFSKIIYTALVIYLIFPVAVGILQIFTYGISIVNMAMVLVSIFLYVFTYLDVNATVLHAHEIEMQALEEDKKSMKRLFDQTATAFVAAMEMKDAFPKGHSAKAAEMAGRIAKAAGKNNDEIDEIYYSALLHNVGVMGIPDGIIENANKLSPEQYEVFKRAPIYSEEILSNIREYPILAVAARYAYEKYDGSGFPEGLKGEAIPEVARIMAVVDAYDSMTTRSKFSDPLPELVVREELIKASGTTLDPVFTDIMVEIMDRMAAEQALTEKKSEDEIEKAILCSAYRDKITKGILIANSPVSISFFAEPRKNKDSDFSAPSIIVFDSYDRRIHTNPRSIDAYKYTEYGEVWFDGHYVSTEARNMEAFVEDVSEDNSDWESGKYVIFATRYEDHVKISMTDGKKDIDVTIALPDSSKFAAIAITGENCYISNITVDRSDEETTEGDITRIADMVSYIQRMESDIPNVQIDSYRSAYTEGVEIDGFMEIAFHSMSLPASNLMWHCPSIVLYYSEDGKVGGPGYKEYALIKLNGEIDKNDLYARNSFTMRKLEDFPGWDAWKKTNKAGLEYEVELHCKGNTITLKTTNMGIEIQNVTTVVDGGDKVYAAISGDMVAITDIRIK